MPDRRTPSAPEKAAGQVLKAIRVEKKLTPTTVAFRLGMSERNLLRYESGANQLSWFQIGDFAWALEEEPHELFDRLAPFLRSRGAVPEPVELERFRLEQGARSVGYGLLIEAGA